MKAYRLHEFGGPASIRLEELPSPQPGPGQVKVRIRAASLNFRDLMISKGVYNPKLRRPMIPLSDGAGEVIATGDGATRFKPGDRVVAAFMPGWRKGAPTDEKVRSALGGDVNGVLAEEVVLPEAGLLPIPARLSFEEAAAIATSSSDDKLAHVREMGAAETINYRTTPEWDRPVRQLTGGRGVDLIVEVGGAGTLPLSTRSIKLGGYIALIGVLTGAGDFNPISLLMRNIRLQGIFVGSVAMFASMLAAIEVSGMRPVIDRVFPFDQAIPALQHLESGAHFGKIVIAV